MNEPYDIKHRKRQGFAMKRKSGRFEFFSSKSPLKRRKRNSYAFGDDESEGHLMRNLQIKKMERISKLIDPTPKSLAQRVTHLIRSAIHGNETLKDGEWSKAYKRLLQFKKALEEKKKLPGAKVYERRLYDIVVDSKYPTISPKRKVLEDGGMDKRDREAIIETLMDISGANDAVNKGLDLLSSFNFTGLEDELVEVGKFEKISE
uniref:Uncharacterized protein n=1 Tax=Parascaris univalens TaxID=6257 RepID=A0A914ZLP8_PARUN